MGSLVIPSWEDYWMSIARAVKARSGDEDSENAMVGAVIVTEDNVLLSTGYNGLARGVQHHTYRVQKDEKGDKKEKLRWMCHAEQNAIFNAARIGVPVAGGTIYTTKFPCVYCANAIVQAGIKVVYTTDTETYEDRILNDDGRRVIHVLLEAGVQLKPPFLTSSMTITSDLVVGEDGEIEKREVDDQDPDKG